MAIRVESIVRRLCLLHAFLGTSVCVYVYTMCTWRTLNAIQLKVKRNSCAQKRIDPLSKICHGTPCYKLWTMVLTIFGIFVVVVVADILVLHLAMHLKQIAAISINLIRIHFNQLQTQWQQPETATRKHGFLCFK